MKAQPVTMIANSEINENYIIFSDSFLVVPAHFVKKSVAPLSFFENFIVPSKKRQEDRKLC